MVFGFRLLINSLIFYMSKHCKPTIRDNTKCKPYQKKSAKTKSKFLKHIYNCKTWKTLRKSYIAEHPLCEICQKNEALSVHHIIPFSSGNTEEEIKLLAYDINNLKALCNECHKFLHNN